MFKVGIKIRHFKVELILTRSILYDLGSLNTYGHLFHSQIAPMVGHFELIQCQIPDISHLNPYGGGGGGVAIDRCIT